MSGRADRLVLLCSRCTSLRGSPRGIEDVRVSRIGPSSLLRTRGHRIARALVKTNSGTGGGRHRFDSNRKAAHDFLMTCNPLQNDESECFDEARLRLTPKLRTRTARKHSGDELSAACGCTAADRAQGRKMKVSLHADNRMQCCGKHFAKGTAMRKLSWIAWSLSRGSWERPGSELDDHRMRAHEAKVPVA